MHFYLMSLALGVLVGVIYALFNVRSPAPPLIALVGLLGILLGEQLPPQLRKFVAPQTAQAFTGAHRATPESVSTANSNPVVGDGKSQP